MYIEQYYNGIGSQMVQTSIILTKTHMKKLKKRSEETGNSRNSIIRTAINEYFQRRAHEQVGD